MILVTGATGNVGRQAVSQLLDAGADVRALTRDPASAALPEGVEAVRGDLADPASLDAALDGVESVLLVWPTLSADDSAAATVERIAAHARRVVYVSARGVSDDLERAPGSILGSHAYLERLIRPSGLEWTFLRPGGFAANTLMWAAQIRDTGAVRWVHGTAARSLIHERDIAAVGVRTLTGAGHGGAAYELTGPQTLTQIEQVAAIGEAIGRPVRWEELSPETARRRDAEGSEPTRPARAVKTN
ncbi:SDR family oxidoreductase [Streptosporangium sp. NBC_01756]|uniref:SDR family oxidoreductase n=1 Tax=Streptosporangium sp. NBC_01756 TaxID=2975950 RepID=UPI002DD7CF67|nr:NAD(P)H-binding protein [Streptosporangium sp. NBC_01756]WSC89572.1 NAD(P)H-binding protein [Streptosporangium sp. NBC_01756]